MIERLRTVQTVHAKLLDRPLLSEAECVLHQTPFQPKPQGGERELTQTTVSSLHAIFAQMCMITQFFGLRKRRVSNQTWNTGGGLLKCPHEIALEYLCLSVSRFLQSSLFRKR